MPNVIPLIPKTPDFSSFGSLYRIQGIGEWDDNFSYNNSGSESGSANATAYSEEVNQATAYSTNDDNIISTSIGYKYKNGIKTDEVALVFGVTRKKPIGEIERDKLIPSKIGNLQTDIKESEIPTAYAIDQGDGVCITSGRCGSLSLAVYDLSDNTLVHMTNNHVIASSSVVYDPSTDTPSDGTTEAQALSRGWRNNPSTSSTGDRGPVKRVDILKYYDDITQRINDKSNTADCGILGLTNGDLANTKCVGLTDGDGNLVEAGPFPFATPQDVQLGMNVFRVSRTSGVISTGQSISSVRYNTNANFGVTNIYFAEQLESEGTNASQAGDSGSPCFIKTAAGDIKFIGLIWGGTSNSCAMSPAWEIAKKCNVRAWNGDVVLASRNDNSLSMLDHSYVWLGYTRKPITHSDSVIV